MVPPDSFWPGGHTHIRGKLPLLGHKLRCCTSTWPSHSFLRGRSHIMAPKLRNIIEFNVNKMSLSVWFTAINRQWLALSGWGINVPMFLLFFGILLQTFSFWAMHFVTHLVTGMKRPKKSFSLHSFLWRPQKAEPQNDQKKCFRQGKFQGRERKRKRKKVSVPTCLPFKVITNPLSRLEKPYFFRKLNLIHEIHFLKDDVCYLCVVIYCDMKCSPIPEEYAENTWFGLIELCCLKNCFVYLRILRSRATLAQPMAWVWGGAVCLADQWQTGRMFGKRVWKQLLVWWS